MLVIGLTPGCIPYVCVLQFACCQSISPFNKLSIWPVQVCWWLCSAFAGLLSTWTAWCGATLTPHPRCTAWSMSRSTLSLESASTWALPSTPSSTTSCPLGSEKCSVMLPVILTAGQHAPAYRCHNAAQCLRKHPVVRNGLKFLRASLGQRKSKNIILREVWQIRGNIE